MTAIITEFFRAYNDRGGVEALAAATDAEIMATQDWADIAADVADVAETIAAIRAHAAEILAGNQYSYAAMALSDYNSASHMERVERDESAWGMTETEARSRRDDMRADGLRAVLVRRANVGGLIGHAFALVP